MGVGKVMNSLLAWLEFCVLLAPIANTPVCSMFWYWVMCALFLFAALVAIAISLSFFSYRRKLRAALEAEARRQAVNHEEIERLRWRGNDHDSDQAARYL